MGYVVLGFTYAVGGLLLGIGLYLALTGSFPGWWKHRIVWPVSRVTPGVARLEGLTAIGLGASIVAIGLSMFASEWVGGLLVVVAMAAYLLAAALFIYGTWRSRTRAV
ncbi:MAG: hypothetical protein ABI334_11140 [Candidatus Dormiibacterota bacterium]